MAAACPAVGRIGLAYKKINNMFTVQRPAPEPANCPYCPYFPVSLVDLRAHLVESHCAAGFKVCVTAGCGLVAASARDLATHCKLVHNAKSKRKVVPSPQVCIRQILKDTKKYLSFVQECCKEDRYLPISDFSLAALLAHALSVPLSAGCKRGRLHLPYPELPVKDRAVPRKDSVSTDFGRDSGMLGSELSYPGKDAAEVT